MRIIYGIIGMALGILVIKYRRQIKGFTGNIAWAEKYLGIGGTYTAILIFGILFFIISLMYMTGTFEPAFGEFFNRFKN